MTDNDKIQPRDDDGVPCCSEECPSHDGKRCAVTGFRPDSICEPAVRLMREELVQLRTGKPQESTRHPMQPVVIGKDGVHRFKENKLVRFMLDSGTQAGLFSLNTLPFVPGVRREDQEQLAQLIGYSMSGACDLDYMSDRVCNAALAESRRITERESAEK